MNKDVAIFVDDNYQELEFWYPYLRLQEQGIKPVVIGKEIQTYKSKLGYSVKAEMASSSVVNQQFAAIIVPGGYAPDTMRCDKSMLTLLKNTHEQGGIIAAICHAPWVLISANIVSGKNMTCYHSIKDDLINAGANYSDSEVVVDGNMITSRQPDDLPAFCREIIKSLFSK